MNKDFFAKLAVTMALLAHTPNIFSEIPTGNVNSKALHDVTYQRLKAEVQNRLVNTWCSSEKAGLIMDLIVSEKLKTCVEIGVFTGSSFLPIASSIQYLSQGHVYAIDAWSNAEAIKYMDDEDPNKNWWACVDMRQAHSFFQNIAQPDAFIHGLNAVVIGNGLGARHARQVRGGQRQRLLDGTGHG